MKYTLFLTFSCSLSKWHFLLQIDQYTHQKIGYLRLISKLLKYCCDKMQPKKFFLLKTDF
jgi:hypothetical protein